MRKNIENIMAVFRVIDENVQLWCLRKVGNRFKNIHKIQKDYL